MSNYQGNHKTTQILFHIHDTIISLQNVFVFFQNKFDLFSSLYYKMTNIHGEPYTIQFTNIPELIVAYRSLGLPNTRIPANVF